MITIKYDNRQIWWSRVKRLHEKQKRKEEQWRKEFVERTLELRAARRWWKPSTWLILGDDNAAHSDISAFSPCRQYEKIMAILEASGWETYSLEDGIVRNILEAEKADD